MHVRSVWPNRATTAASATPPTPPPRAPHGQTRSHRGDVAVTVTIVTVAVTRVRCAALRPSGGGGEARACAGRRVPSAPRPARLFPTTSSDAAEAPRPTAPC